MFISYKIISIVQPHLLIFVNFYDNLSIEQKQDTKKKKFSKSCCSNFREIR